MAEEEEPIHPLTKKLGQRVLDMCVKGEEQKVDPADVLAQVVHYVMLASPSYFFTELADTLDPIFWPEGNDEILGAIRGVVLSLSRQLSEQAEETPLSAR